MTTSAAVMKNRKDFQNRKKFLKKAYVAGL
jgi:hypothetical protein